MGGLLCWARRSAILQYETVPAHQDEKKKFDAQMRVLYAAPGITESLLSDANDKITLICDTLAKTVWSDTDRQFLLDTVESLYE
jgi:hypothetical protein